MKDDLITKKQAVAYGIIALYTLENSATKINALQLAEEMITVMKLCNPKNAIKGANKILQKAC